MRILALIVILGFSTAAFAKGHVETADEAIVSAEKALDNGAIGDAETVGARLQKTHGLSKDQQRRADLIVARCGLATGKYDVSEKLFAKLRKATPEDTRLAEWYARALDGAGKSDAALALLAELAQKDALSDGDSYWALAQLERKKGDDAQALAHAKLALEKPIVLQSDELDQAIHQFIDELSSTKSKTAPKSK